MKNLLLKVSFLLGLMAMLCHLPIVAQSTFTMSAGTHSLTSCSTMVYDNGGPTGSYSSNSDDTLIVYPASTGCKVALSGTYYTESATWDYIKIYNGAGTSGTELAILAGNSSVTTPITSTANNGALTIVFHSDGSVQYSGFEFYIQCVGSCMCSSPMGVNATSGDHFIIVSWNSSTLTHGYILEYGLHGFTPGTGTQMYTTSTSYTINNLINNTEYDIYVWYDCGNDHQITTEIPTLVSAMPMNAYIMSSGTHTLTTCDITLYDNGGPTGSYSNNSNDTLIIYPATSGCKVSFSGTYYTESASFDYIKIYDGVGVSGTELATLAGNSSITAPIASSATNGALTVVFHSDGSVQYSGFEFQVGCMGGCACGGPSGVVAVTGDQTVTLSWDAALGVGGYFVVCGPHGFTPGNGTSIFTTATSYAFNNLTNDTEYDFYVWYDCGNDHQITTEIPTLVSAIPMNGYIMSSGTHTLTTCDITIYDNGGPTGNYVVSSKDTLIIYPATAGCKLSIAGTYDLEYCTTCDYVQIYDGEGVTGTLITTLTGHNGSLTAPTFSTAANGALTVVFRSDGSLQYSGFELQVSCICNIVHIQDTVCFRERYQRYGFDTTFAYFGDYNLCRIGTDGTLTEVSLHVRPKPHVSISGGYYFCADGDITLTANNAVSYSWSTGEHSQSIQVHDIGNYQVTITDVNGCTANTYHRISPIEEFIELINFPTMCAGNSYPITGSYETGSEILMSRTQSTLTSSDTAFLPDGVPCEPYGCSYESTLTFTDYSENSVVMSEEDIYYVKINLEHSFIGDIYINITCPNGQKADIMRWSGSGSTECSSLIPASSRGWQDGGDNYTTADFGVSYDDEDYDNKCDKTAEENAPGTGWNYCWSNNTTQGYVYSSSAGSLVYRSANVHNGSVDSSNVTAGTQFYHPDESFASLIGCPLNGSWYIEVMDGWGIDNGYIFGWELALTEELLSSNTFHVSQIVPDDIWTTIVSDSSFTISPPGTLQQDTTLQYSLHFYDSGGCSFDTVVPVHVYAQYDVEVWESASDSYTWNGVTYTSTPSTPLTHTYHTAAGCDSVVTLHLTIGNIEASVTNDGPYCEGDTIHLICENPQAGVTYSWTGPNGWASSEVNPIIYPASLEMNGTYTLVKTLNGDSSAQASTTVQVGQMNTSVNVSPSDTICVGDEVTLTVECFAEDSVIFNEGFAAILTGNDDSSTGSNQKYQCTLPNFPNCDNEHVFLAGGHLRFGDVNTGGGGYITSRSMDLSQPFTVKMWMRGWKSSRETPWFYLKVDNDTVLQQYIPTSEFSDPYTEYDYISLAGATANSTITIGNKDVHQRFFLDSVVVVRDGDCLYSWNTGATTNSITVSPSQSSDYYVTVTSAAGCTEVDTFNIVVNPRSVVTFDPCGGTCAISSMIMDCHDGIVLPPAVPCASNYEFAGWSPTPVNVAASTEPTPLYLVGEQYFASADITLYAVYKICQTAEEVRYAKVAAAPANWSGEYLIAYHDGSLVFDGSRTTLDAVSNYQNVTFNGNYVNNAAALAPYTFTINQVNANTYTIRSASGYYIGRNTDANGMLSSQTTQYNNTIRYNGGDVDIVGSGGAYLRFNSATDQNRFRYYKSNTYTSQKAIQLYRKELVEVEGNCEWVSYPSCPVSIAVDANSDPNGACNPQTIVPPTFTVTDACFDNPTATVTSGGVVVQGCNRSQSWTATYENACGESATPVSVTYTWRVSPDTVTCSSIICENETIVLFDTVLATSGVYTRTGISNCGCDSTVTLHLTVNQPTTGDTTAVECDSFDWYEHTNITESGDYTHLFVGGNANGCDSTLTLHLTINQPTTGDTAAVECESFSWYEHTNITESGDYTHLFVGGNSTGCDSTVTLHLTINQPATGDTTAVECESFDWYEHTNLTESGNYTHVFEHGAPNGCDSTVTLHLTINQPATGDTTAVECVSFDWYEHTNLTESGNYTHLFEHGAPNGCDSTVTLHLTINQPTTGDTSAVVCESFSWYEHTNLTESGNYTHLFVGGNSTGCDSTVTLHLLINQPTTGDTSAVECVRFNWYEHTNLTESGNYTHLFVGGNSTGCDSTVTLHLTINQPTAGDTAAVECESFSWYEHTNITESGDYTHLFVGGNSTGCDSTVTLHLTINQPATGDTTAVVCESFDWYENTNLTQSGDYTHVFVGGNAAGCDSIVTLHLTINEPTTGDTTAVECGRYDWYDHTNITESGDYTHVFVGGNANGCDSTVTLHLTIYEPTTGDTTAVECERFDWYEHENLTRSGEYTHVFAGGNAAGCDSTVTLHLTIHKSITTIDERQSCGEFTWINGTTYSESIDTPTVTLTSSVGCDSVVTLHLTIKEILTSIDYQESCGAFTWINDVTYTESTDTPTVTLASSTGCDSIVTLHLTINQPTTGDTTAVECDSFDWYENTNLTRSGDYTHVFAGGNANGCDSVVVLHLLIQKPDTIRYDGTVCKGTPFREYGFDSLVTTSGTYLLTRTLYAQQTQCDTLVELTLHVVETPVISTVAQAVCPSSNSVEVVAQFQNLSGDNNTVTWTSNNVVETHDNLVTPLHPKDSFTMQIPLNLCDDSLSYTVEYSDGICMVTETNFIHVVDTVPPAVNGVLPSLNLAGCSEDDVPSAFTNASEINALDNISIADNCTSMENITIQHSDSVVSASCDISRVRIYTLTDICGNATRLMQDITLVRTSDFTISQVDTADTVICFSMALAENFTLPEVQDACGLVLQPSSDSPTVSGLDGSCEGSVRYTYTYRNCSGGDTVWTFTYHIALPDSFTSFPANGVGEVQCLADVLPPTPPVVEDACGNTLNVTSLDSTQNVNPDGSGTVDFLFRYSDCAGNDSVWTYTYTLTPNQFTPKPDLYDTVYCVSEALDDTVPVVTNCGIPVALTHGVDTNRVEDGCGDLAYVYNYTVNDVHYTWTHYYHVAPEPFVLPVTPEFFVQCLDSAVQVDPPFVVNACSDTIHPIALPVSIHSDGCTGYVTYAWDYVDCSGDTARWTCTYVVADTTPPTFIVPADMVICRDTNGTYDADPAVTGIAIRISDNCSSLQEISNSCQETLIAGANGVDTLLRQWIVKDNCDNENVQTQRITIMPVRYTTIVDSICEGEMYDTLNFNFVANVDTVVYQQLSSHETGCDSLITLNLTVFHPVNESDSVTTVDEYTWNGITYAQSGMYTHHHPDIHGCDQVDTLYLTIHYPSSSDIYDTACDSYTWNGVDYTESGVYTQHFTNGFNADSTAVLHLTINHSKYTTIYDTVCYTYEWNGVVYTETGVYEQHFQTSDGCDSVVTLELRVNYNIETIIQENACEEYTWYDVTYTESGIYTKTLESSDLCDSTVILYLTINHDVSLEWWDTVCNVKQWNDEFYTESGEYVQHFETALGCDSAVTLHLVVNHSDTTVFDATGCDTYTWENIEYAQSGEYTRTFTNQFGCDSMVTMRLTIHSATYSTLYDTITQNSLPYDTLGMHFTEAGTKKDTILNQYGCDSIVTMHLFVAQNIVVDVDRTICENDLPFTWNHVVFNQAGTMNDTLTAANGSDSIIVMTLNVNSNTYSTENEFVIENNLPHVFNGHTFTGPVTNEQIVIPNANGCDSIITYSLQVWYNVKDTVERTICENDIPYSWNNVQFTAPGMQNAVFTLPNGADSVLTMVLFVHNNTQSTIYDTIVENGLPYDTLDMHFSDAGTLSDTIANANGCDSIVTMHLYVWYNVANTVDSTVCENNLPIVWNDVVFEAAGENTIVLVGNHGVDSVVTMRLAVIPKDVSVFHDEVCEGRDYYGHGFVVPGNQTVHIPAHHLSIENTFENELGCDSIVHLELDIVDTTVYIRPLFDFCDNMSTTLSVYTQMTDYVWSTGETSQNIDVTAPGLYSVTAMQGDCQSEAVISIEDCPTEIYLPNAITPGKLDGHNDCFSLPERCQNMIDEFEITIFNRWGQPVFHSKDKAFKWYGEYKDNVYRQNVYEYLIDYTENNRFHRKVKLRGSVVVL